MIDTKALRQKILDMAIRGKLVPQDPNDEPASVLLERIRAEKQQLIKEGKIKKDKNDSVIFKGDDNRYYEKVGSEVKDITDELPFEIPDNWVWIRLGYIVDFSQSDTVAASQINPSSWVLDLEDIEKDSGKLLQRKTFGETQSKSDKHCFFKGNVLYSKLRPYLNKVIVADADGYCTTEILVFNFGQHIAAQYAKTFFMSPYFVDYAMDGAYGVKMPRIGSHRGNSALMPVPPYTEQIHLVNRIDELFEQIDIIEQNQTDIDTLYDEFRKRTLTLAIQGKLVPQNPNDEPASVLLERIRAEKKAKLGKKYVDSYIYKSDDNCYYEKVGTNEPARLDNLPFDIPDSWCWTRLENAVIINPRNDLPDNLEVSFVEMKAIADGYNNHFSAATRPWKEVKSGFTHFQNGDVGFAKITPCFQNRKSVVFSSLQNEYGAGTTELHILRPIRRTILPKYLLCFVKSPYLIEHGKQKFSGTAGQQRFGTDEVKKTLFPLPPLVEQYRIVKRAEIILEKLKDED